MQPPEALQHYTIFCRFRIPLSATVREKGLFLSGSPGLPFTVASRIISWISGASIRLDALLQRGLSDGARSMSILVPT
jgi:hypothetical protein